METIQPLAARCHTPRTHDLVLNSECAYTFHSPYTSPEGILVSLSEPFIGFHPNVAVQTWSQSDRLAYLNDRLFVRIVKRKEKIISSGENDGEEIMKLGVGVVGGFQSEQEKYNETSTYSIVVLNALDGTVMVELLYNDETKNDFPMQVSNSADAVILHSGMIMQQDVMEWEMDEEPKPVSKYCDSLEFVDNGVQISPDPSTWKCEKSGDTENLWLNLSDGFIGGGRRNWDGSGGSNGAIDHFEETGEKYPLVVKLGTITTDVQCADCYSYAKDENGPVKIPNLAELLSKRGINVTSLKKTAKSIAEMEVELNATYAFDAITEESNNLTPVNGPGLQGLQNLGNSCYINSVVQSLFSGIIPELSSRYGTSKNENIFSQTLLKVKPANAPSDFLCQTSKLASALTSGDFTKHNHTTEARLAPRMFKHVVGGNHVDFKTGQQQDAAEYFQFFLESLDRAEKGSIERLNKYSNNSSQPAPLSSSLFAHRMVERILCKGDGQVKYRESAPETIFALRIPMEKIAKSDTEIPEMKRLKSVENNGTPEAKDNVPTLSFESCLDAWAEPTTIDDFRWSHLQNQIYPGVSTSRFLNFPRFLVMQLQRYTIGDDWTPKKLEVKIDIPETIDISSFRSNGPQDGEQIIPDEASINNGNIQQMANNQNTLTIDEGALSQLMDMGFSMNGCKRALKTVGGSNIEAAMNWIFEHSQDSDFNDSVDESQSQPLTSSICVDDAIVTSLVESLGCFTYEQVIGALQITNGSADRAADWLFSHMDNLDDAIQVAQGNASANTSSVKIDSSRFNVSQALDDGNGIYELIGMISHIGKNTGSGHYVCHLKKGGKWAIFNDEKVALSESPPFQHAYLYIFQRSDSIGSPNSGF